MLLKIRCKIKLILLLLSSGFRAQTIEAASLREGWIKLRINVRLHCASPTSIEKKSGVICAFNDLILQGFFSYLCIFIKLNMYCSLNAKPPLVLPPLLNTSNEKNCIQFLITTKKNCHNCKFQIKKRRPQRFASTSFPPNLKQLRWRKMRIQRFTCARLIAFIPYSLYFWMRQNLWAFCGINAYITWLYVFTLHGWKPASILK